MSKSVKSKLSSNHNKDNSRASYLTNINKQMFMQEKISKENDFRTNNYVKNRQNCLESVQSRQHEVYKNKLERSKVKPVDGGDIYLKLKTHTPKDHRIRRVDPEKLCLEQCAAAMKRNDCVPDNLPDASQANPSNPYTNNSEYGWWLNSVENEGFTNNEAFGFGRKSIVKETFYRRNDSGSCMAV